MKITIVGTGYVGLVSGTCFADLGWDVVCVDRNSEIISTLESGQVHFFEPGLAEMIDTNSQSGRLRFSTDLAKEAPDADLVFIAVGTPTKEGALEADLSAVYAVAKQLAPLLKPGAAVVTKSTVPVGTNREVKRIILEQRGQADFGVISNPEFLREGNAVADFMAPDRILVGVEQDGDAERMAALYKPLTDNGYPLVVTDLNTAELSKYAANALLATKIGFINEMASLCEAADGNVVDLSRAIGLDSRIGEKFLNPGPGYGGSCFPKDTRALSHTGRAMGAPLAIVDAVIQSNEDRKQALADRLEQQFSGLAGKTIALLGVSFKANTDDIRESPSLVIIDKLLASGTTVRAFDFEAMDNGRELYPSITWCEDAYDACDGAEGVIIATEWAAFAELDLEKLQRVLKTPIMVDLRNLYEPTQVAAAGLTYHSVGR